MKIIKVLALSILTCVMACSKEEVIPDPIYKISGYYYDECHQPISNVRLDLRNGEVGSIFNGWNVNAGYVSSSITDSTGYFEFNHKETTGLSIDEHRNGPDILLAHGIFPSKNWTDIKLYRYATFNQIIRLDASSTLTTDSLTIRNYDFWWKDTVLYKPFSSGILFNTDEPINVNYFDEEMQHSYSERQSEVWVKFNNDDYTKYYFDYEVCGQVEVVINIP